MPILVFLKSLANKNTVIGIATSVAIVAISDAYIQHQKVKQMQAVYDNPQKVEVVKVVREKGPVQIKTIIVEKPTGEKITTRTEDHGASLEQLLSGTESKPSPVSETMASPRTDRWLAGLSLRDFSPKEIRYYTVWGGYSFRNRFDLLGGLNYDEGLHPSVQGILRF